MCFREATGAQVNRFPNMLQCGFKTYNEAQSAWLHSCANHTVGPPQAPVPSIVSIRDPVVPHGLTPSPAIPPVSTTCPPPHCALLGGLKKGHDPSVASPSLQRDVPSTPAVSQLFPSVSTPPPRHNNSLTQHCTAPHPMSISDEDAFWVVM